VNEAPSIIFGLAAAAAFALIATGIWLLRQPGGNRLKATLMIVAGIVILFNAWINTLPVPAPMV
jgi:type IV secretory pathway VirB2 component (pilin)